MKILMLAIVLNIVHFIILYDLPVVIATVSCL